LAGSISRSTPFLIGNGAEGGVANVLRDGRASATKFANAAHAESR